MRVAICEDEADLRADLRGQCSRRLNEAAVEYAVDIFSSTQGLHDAMASGVKYDLLCLDILMPNRNGMESAWEVRRHDDNVSILFITGSTEFLQEGCGVRPIQYLLKPVKEEALAEAIKTDLRLHHQSQVIVLRTGNNNNDPPALLKW